MSTSSNTARKEPQPTQPVRPETPAERSLETLLSEIRADAQREPERFLRDSRVPEGGE